MRIRRVDPVSIEELPQGRKEALEDYLHSHPDCLAAKVRPKTWMERNVWFALAGKDMVSGVVGFGRTIVAALESWEANYREATHSQQ
jgi:hypothetical protein